MAPTTDPAPSSAAGPSSQNPPDAINPPNNPQTQNTGKGPLPRKNTTNQNSHSQQEEYLAHLQKTKTLANSLDTKTRKILERQARSKNVTISDTDTSDGPTDTSETDDATSDDDHTPSKKSKKTHKTRYKQHQMNKLLHTHQKAIHELAGKVGPTDNNEKLPQSHSNITLKPPSLPTTKADLKTFREATQSFKDVYRSAITGEEETSDILTFLQIAANIATQIQLNAEQFYYLLMVRVPPGTPLYKDLITNFESQTSIKNLFKQLLTLYGGNSSYLSSLKRFNQFTGRDMSCNLFISTLKSLASQLGKVSQIEPDKMPDFVLNKIREKTFHLLPSLAPTLLEKDLQYRKGTHDTGNITTFQTLLMNHAPTIEAQLQRPKRVNMIQDSFHSQPFPDSDYHEFQINALQQPPRGPMKITRHQYMALRDKCFKCANLSPIQKESHLARNCQLYSQEPLAYSVCSKCQTGVHLNKFCKYQDNAAIQEKADTLGIPFNPSQTELDSMDILFIDSLSDSETDQKN